MVIAISVSLSVDRIEVADLARLGHAAAARALRELVPQIGQGDLGAESLEQPIDSVLPLSGTSPYQDEPSGAICSAIHWTKRQDSHWKIR
jgi:hypothetical protein